MNLAVLILGLSTGLCYESFDSKRNITDNLVSKENMTDPLAKEDVSVAIAEQNGTHSLVVENVTNVPTEENEYGVLSEENGSFENNIEGVEDDLDSSELYKSKRKSRRRVAVHITNVIFELPSVKHNISDHTSNDSETSSLSDERNPSRESTDSETTSLLGEKTDFVSANITEHDMSSDLMAKDDSFDEIRNFFDEMIPLFFELISNDRGEEIFKTDGGDNNISHETKLVVENQDSDLHDIQTLDGLDTFVDTLKEISNMFESAKISIDIKGIHPTEKPERAITPEITMATSTISNKLPKHTKPHKVMTTFPSIKTSKPFESPGKEKVDSEVIVYYYNSNTNTYPSAYDEDDYYYGAYYALPYYYNGDDYAYYGDNSRMIKPRNPQENPVSGNPSDYNVPGRTLPTRQHSIVKTFPWNGSTLLPNVNINKNLRTHAGKSKLLKYIGH